MKKKMEVMVKLKFKLSKRQQALNLNPNRMKLNQILMLLRTEKVSPFQQPSMKLSEHSKIGKLGQAELEA